MQGINNFRFVSPLSPFSHDSSTFLYLIFPTPFLVKWLNKLMPTPSTHHLFYSHYHRRFSHQSTLHFSSTSFPSYLHLWSLSISFHFISPISYAFTSPGPLLFLLFISSFTLPMRHAWPFLWVFCIHIFSNFSCFYSQMRWYGCNGGGSSSGGARTYEDRFGCFYTGQCMHEILVRFNEKVKLKIFWPILFYWAVPISRATYAVTLCLGHHQKIMNIPG